MSSKIGLILSMIFVVTFFLLGIDLINLQYVYTELDQKAINISYLIAKRGNLDSQFILELENHYKVDFVCMSNCTPKFGDVVEYQISSQFDPLIISNQKMKVYVYRSAIIGYYE